MGNMLRPEIQRPGKPPVVQDVEPDTYLVGSDEDSRIVLPGPEVSGRHAVLFLNATECWVEDLTSRTGTYVSGHRVEGRSQLLFGQELVIGPYLLVVRSDTGTVTLRSPPAPTPVARPLPIPGSVETMPAPEVRIAPTAAASQHIRSIKAQIHEELVKRLNLKRMAGNRLGEEDLRKRVMSTVSDIVIEVGSRLPPDIKPPALVKEIFDEAVGLGPLEDLLADQTVTEIMVNGPDRIFVEKQGKIVLTGLTFLDDASVLAIIERIVSPLGRRIDESQPYVDARLKDGSRVNAIIHPLSLIGPCLTIRKFSKIPFTVQDMIRFGTMTPLMAEFVHGCVLARKNIVISGGTGSGKTSLLNVFSSYLPATERIVTIEDAAELRLTQDHVIRLESRPPNIENKGAVTIRDLVRNCLRMRPDRIVVGECRGGEALDMLQAMNTGHDGSLTTVHANSPRDVISRLETMVLMSGMDLPVRAIREQITSAIQLIVHETRLSDGTRRITNISEVVGLEGDRVTMQDLFKFEQTGIDPSGRVLGHFMACGTVPTFADEFKKRGIELNPAMFDPQKWGQKTCA
ncbi:MAG: ATPase, T2SS/T4P/T4SS family [bacterium]